MIIKVGRYQVRREELPKAVTAVKAFVDEVRRKEGGTASYHAYQDKQDPTRFMHLVAFRVPSAESYHAKTAWMKRFQETVHPLCVAPPVFDEMAELEAP